MLCLNYIHALQIWESSIATCSFCMKETSSKTKIVWSQVMLLLEDTLAIPLIMPNSVIFSFTDCEAKYQLISHFLVFLKYYVYKAGENRRLDLQIKKKH